MPKITNRSNRTFSLKTAALELRPGRSAEISRAHLTHPDNVGYIESWVQSGRLEIGGVERRPPHAQLIQEREMTKTRFNNLPRKELAELAEAHGMERQVIETLKVSELRAAVAKLVFIDL
jgi:hypothetical protein